MNSDTAVAPSLAHFTGYSRRLAATLEGFDWTPVEELANDLLMCWRTGAQLFIAGNGGSAGNANHMANDLLYPLSKRKGSGIRVHALAANPAVMTCLANDEGYENVFAYQLAILGRPGDIVLTLSGSGNSPNILRLIEEARSMNIKSYAILGYSGGHAKNLADVPIHFAVDDMQVAEDTQLIIGHMLMQWLSARRDAVTAQV